MHPNIANSDQAGSARPIWCAAAAEDVPPPARAWAGATGFDFGAGKHLLVPDASGGIAGVLLGTQAKPGRALNPFFTGNLAAALPGGVYRLENCPGDVRLATLGFLFGTYRFGRYTGAKPWPAQLVLPQSVDAAEIARLTEATFLGRDLVNTPANDLGPDELEAAIRELAAAHGAEVNTTLGEALLDANLPMIFAVGQASPRLPRLIDLRWGDPAHPRVTLVGKGVCFDTGGLDIKPDAAMLLMKKDMGGAAAALAVAAMVMDAGLPLRLRLLVPAVENSISGAAFRPGDVLQSRKGLTVQVGNTDAEGRLVLADALTLADEEAPDLLVDFATLTGAARVALGPELPPLYTDDEALAADLLAAAARENDPLWRLPLWSAYDRMLDSKIASLNNVGSGGMAGSITAALFLRRFVERTKGWAHMDIYAWNPATRPAHPEGGDVQGARALFALLSDRYAANVR